MNLARAGRRLVAVRRAKWAFARRLRDEGDHLSPGLWFLESPSSARRLTSARPPVATASTAQPSATGRALAVLTILTPPSLLFHTAWSARGAATSAILTKAGGLVLFDPAEGRVTHRRQSPLPEGYAPMRELLERYLPGPAWSTSADRGTLSEGLVVGTVLRTRPAAERVRIAREILSRCASLTRDAVAGGGRDDSAGLVTDALAQVATHADVAPDLMADLAAIGPELAAAASSWPLVPAHGDLTGLNVLVSPGGDWMAIDFEDSGELPYFFDAFSLLVRDRVLLDEARRGAFVDELAALDEAAGVRTSVRETELKLMATALLAAVRHSTNHGGTLSFTLSSLWPAGRAVDGR